jgi:hypothetical protein
VVVQRVAAPRGIAYLGFFVDDLVVFGLLALFSPMGGELLAVCEQLGYVINELVSFAFCAALSRSCA